MRLCLLRSSAPCGRLVFPVRPTCAVVKVGFEFERLLREDDRLERERPVGSRGPPLGMPCGRNAPDPPDDLVQLLLTVEDHTLARSARNLQSPGSTRVGETDSHRGPRVAP